MLTPGLAILAFVFAAVAFWRCGHVFTTRLAERRAVGRLYRLTREQTAGRRLHSPHRAHSLAA